MLLLVLADFASAGNNYLVIIADDLGADKVASFADDDPTHAAIAPTFLPQTPVIDGLAAAGARFTQAWAAPSCTPTRASIQTGDFPFRHRFGAALNDGEGGINPFAYLDGTQSPDQLLGVLFEDAGYATAAFGKWHLGTANANGNTGIPGGPTINVAPHPVLLGYESFLGTITGELNPEYDDWPRVSWDPTTGSGTSTDSTDHATGETTDEAILWIQDQELSNVPWLAFVNYHAPHSDGDDTWLAEDVPSDCSYGLGVCATGCSAEDEARDVYRVLVQCMDEDIGQILASIDLTDTIVVFLGDNGTPDAVMEADYVSAVGTGGKGTTDETGIRVPLVVAHGETWADGTPTSIPAGVVVTEPVHVLDLHATLLEDANLEAVLGRTLADTDSESLWDCLENGTADCGRSTSFHYTEKFDGARSTAGKIVSTTEAVAAVRWGQDKLEIVYDATNVCLNQRFYDLDLDWHATSPMGNVRKDRLRDYFETLQAQPWGTNATWCP